MFETLHKKKRTFSKDSQKNRRNHKYVKSGQVLPFYGKTLGLFLAILMNPAVTNLL